MVRFVNQTNPLFDYQILKKYLYDNQKFESFLQV